MPVPPDFAFAEIATLGRALRAGETTARELAEFFLDRCTALGPKFNAVVTLTRETALADADAADADLAAGRDRGPLHGIPYGAKDLLAAKGYPTTWGAAPFKEQIFDADATVVRRLREAGAVLVAKLAMVEIAGGLGYMQADAAFTGPGLCAWDPKRWSGGSSSGSGSAVGAGLVPFAIGSETWGSIMTPAAYCGLSGLRPTYGRVSRHGAMALSWTMDKLGPLCHSAHDCGLVLQAIAGRDDADDSSLELPYHYPPTEPPRKPFRLATIRGADERTQPEVGANYRQALEVLGEFATFEEIDLPDTPANTAADVILSCEAAAAFEDLIRSGQIQDMTAEEDRWRIYSDLMTPATTYINALRFRRQAQHVLDELLAPFDAVVTPTVSTVAGPVDLPFSQWSRGFSASNIGGIGNLCGVPAISVHNGFGEGRLPTGMQFVARAFDENVLLAIAGEYQQRTDWHHQHPDV